MGCQSRRGCREGRKVGCDLCETLLRLLSMALSTHFVELRLSFFEGQCIQIYMGAAVNAIWTTAALNGRIERCASDWYIGFVANF